MCVYTSTCTLHATHVIHYTCVYTSTCTHGILGRTWAVMLVLVIYLWISVWFHIYPTKQSCSGWKRNNENKWLTVIKVHAKDLQGIEWEWIFPHQMSSDRELLMHSLCWVTLPVREVSSWLLLLLFFFFHSGWVFE